MSNNRMRLEESSATSFTIILDCVKLSANRLTKLKSTGTTTNKGLKEPSFDGKSPVPVSIMDRVFAIFRLPARIP
jgi:hypothetical protein